MVFLVLADRLKAAMPRNYVDEILEIKSRLKYEAPPFSKPHRLMFLESELTKESLSEELFKYFPIAVVACIESYFRAAIRDLIDAGSPFADRIETLKVPNLKFDTALVKAIAGKTITLGELIAHTIPLNNLELLNSYMSALTGEEFLRKLETVRNRFKVEVEKGPDDPMLNNANQVFADVARTFELRHIFAHEGDTAKAIPSEISRCFESANLFMEASVQYITNLLRPDLPLTQTAMTIAASEELAKARERVVRATQHIDQHLDEKRKTEFDAMNAAFKLYCLADAEFFTNAIWGEGGTGRSTFWMARAEVITTEYASSLERIVPTLENIKTG